MPSITPEHLALDRARNAKHLVKIYQSPKNAAQQERFQHHLHQSLVDRSVGVHWSIAEDISCVDDPRQSVRDFMTRNHPHIKPRTVASWARQFALFVDDIQVGDDIILGQGACDGRHDKVLLVAKVASTCYFDNRTQWEDNDHLGPFHRRKLVDIVKLPSGTSLATPGSGRLCTVAKKPQTGWGVTYVLNDKIELDKADRFDDIADEVEDGGDSYTAIRMLRRGLAIRERVLGNHEDTAMSHDLIGGALERQGDLFGALDEFRKCLSIREELWGKDDPRTDELNLRETIVELENACSDAESFHTYLSNAIEVTPDQEMVTDAI